MSTADLSQVLGVQPVGPGRFRGEFPDGWQQGRGLFGGLVLGCMTRAAEAFQGEADRPLRTLSGELCGPAQPGSAELHCEMLRRSSGVSTVAVRLLQGGELQAHAVAVFGRTRITDRSFSGRRPSPPPPESVPPVPLGEAYGTIFARHFEYRSLGPVPFTGAPEMWTEGWIRPRLASQGLHRAELVALVDTYWPSIVVAESAFRPMVTLTFAVHILPSESELPLPPAPLHYRARALGSRDGFATELRELFDAAGNLLAVNQQTFVYVR